MNERSGRFDPSELRPTDGPSLADVDSAAALGAARSLEALTAGAAVDPTPGFADRVMAAIATETVPKVIVRPASTVRGGRPAAFLIAVRDAWGVAFAGGRPPLVRAQAMGFVLLVAAATVSVSGFAAAGAAGLLSSPSAPPAISPMPAPTSEPSSVAPSSSPSPMPTPTDDARSAAPAATDPAASAGSDDPSAPSPSSKAGSSRTPRPSATARPTRTPDATDEPDETDEPDGTDHPDGTDEPEPTDDHGSGGDDHSGPG